ncbi:MAG: hypothetical protein LBB66_10010 [Desulfovibrio sp.]|jgi:hypothetical protein|nr:hypothetical protein [Desulfovibrio sp.]
MKEQDYFLIILGIVVLLMVTLAFLRKKRQSQKRAARRKTILMDLLRKAQGQNESFDIKLLGEENGKYGLSALLQKINDQQLEMEVLEYVSAEWVGTSVDVYFRVTLQEGPIFYKFRAVVQKLKAQSQHSRLFITPPQDLEVGQKRNFIRVRPPRESVRAVAVWYLDPNRPMPRTTSEVAPPLFHYRYGMDAAPVVLENISSTGFALRFSLSDPSEPPDYLTTGSQLLCLVIYSADENNEQFNIFWSTNEIVNSRAEEGENPTLVLGTMFTNWAMLGQGKTDIHWFHTSPTRGVMPITQWVMQIDRKQRLLI